MAEAARPGLHLVDGAVLNGGDGRNPSLLAMRVARPIVDRLDRRDRGRVAALVACVSDADAQCGRSVARLAVGGLSLTSSLALNVSGVSACGLFTGLHVAQAVQRSLGGAMVLLVSVDAERSGAVLLGDQGRTVCLPLPPTSAEHSPHDAAGAPLAGGGLARALARGGVAARTIDRAVSPGMTGEDVAFSLRNAGLERSLEATTGPRVASSEEVLARAAFRAPEGRTLVWGRDRGGRIGACVLQRA